MTAQQGHAGMIDDEDGPTGVHELDIDGEMDPDAILREFEDQEPEGGASSDSSDGADGAASEGVDSAAYQELNERYLRTLADLDNFRKRQARLQADMRRYGHEAAMREILPPLDNLERALDAARKAGPELESHVQGLTMIVQQFAQALGRLGVTPVAAVDRPFDPALHEAIQEMPDAERAPNTVLYELERGYQLWDRLLRPAKVVVSRRPDEAPAAAEPEPEAGGDA